MKQAFYERLKSINDYSACKRYENGELVDPAAYRRWIALREKMVAAEGLRVLKAMGWNKDEIIMK